MRVGICSPYLDTLGGGERYILTAAEYFQSRGDHVEIFWEGEKSLVQMADRFGLKLDHCHLVRNIFSQDKDIASKLWETWRYDLIFFLSDGSLPASLAKKNFVHLQIPHKLANQRTILNRLKLFKINSILCNSEFTKKEVDKTYGVQSAVVYPPVDVQRFRPGKKENIVLSVGRFSWPLEPKKHWLMIKTFRKMRENGLTDWQLVMLGAVFKEQETNVDKLRALGKDLPLKIITDIKFDLLRDYFARAKIYWHAAGYGEDLKNHPDRAEHFGISTVEAMAAGCVPIVFAGGGQVEIIEDGKSGLFWRTPEELVNKTFSVIHDNKRLSAIKEAAMKRAEIFSKERFFKDLERLTS